MSIARVLQSLNRVSLVFFALVLASTCGLADDSQPDIPHPAELSLLGVFGVRAVVDGDTLVLEDEREVRLTGIQAPKLPLDRPNFPTWPLAPEAKAELERLAIGQNVSLYVDGAGQDRYRRILAHPVLEDGRWLQAEMVKRGLARVYSFSDNRRMATALYRYEQDARKQGVGIWQNAFYAVRSSNPEERLGDAGTFQVVEGLVVEAAKVRSRIYLNFGDDYRTDFTASIERSAWAMFEDAGVDPLHLQGQAIRVRGWIKDFNGPLIDVTHPEQIEILSP